MLAEMQSAMTNMVNNQLQNDFQLASLSSPCPAVTLPTPALQVAPSSPLPPPLPPPSSSPPPPSPSVDSTISAIACAHRETFLYAHDKLTNPHAPPQQDNHGHHHEGAELCSDRFLRNDNHRNNSHLQQDHNAANNHHSNRGWSLHPGNENGGGSHVTQRQSCPLKKRSGIVLVRSGPPTSDP